MQVALELMWKDGTDISPTPVCAIDPITCPDGHLHFDEVAYNLTARDTQHIFGLDGSGLAGASEILPRDASAWHSAAVRAQNIATKLESMRDTYSIAVRETQDLTGADVTLNGELPAKSARDAAAAVLLHIDQAGRRSIAPRDASSCIVVGEKTNYRSEWIDLQPYIDYANAIVKAVTHAIEQSEILGGTFFFKWHTPRSRTATTVVQDNRPTHKLKG